LNRVRSYGTFTKTEVTREEVVAMMAGGEELHELSIELEEFARTDKALANQLHEIGHTLEDAAAQVDQRHRSDHLP
jgi:hypothetical protein